MAMLQTNGLTNGHDVSHEAHHGLQRFSDIPRTMEVPVSGGEEQEAVEVDLEELLDDTTELCTLLENENAETRLWITTALAYGKQHKLDLAIDIINKGVEALKGKPADTLPLHNCLCWLYLWKSREAPRVKSEGTVEQDIKTKDYFLRAATQTLNDASRISPSHPPLFLARGVLCLLRAGLQQDQTEKSESLRQAVKCFEDSQRTSGGKNMMARLGKSRAYFSLGKYADALHGYQEVLAHAPDCSDPDPRIGIGCCLWQLGHKDDAMTAWQRALEVNPDSKIANILLGLHHLNSSSRFATTDPEFAPLYKKAMVQYTQKAFKLDNDLPLACATFGSYFLVKKQMPFVEKLARKAIELTDVNAIASDGWYLLARKEHYGDDHSRAGEYYLRADQARGGDERGYLPAKFGAAQIKVLQQDLDGAKFRLEKLIQQSKSVEAMTLLGTLLAEEVFSGQAGATREEQQNSARKAISLLEAVRVTWKDPKRHILPDSSVLLNLARLYEIDSPEKSLQCLQQVEQMELDELPEDLQPAGVDAENPGAMETALREHLPPQLLNNIACFHYQAHRLEDARQLFQTALNACVKLGDKAEGTDTDAVVTTISYNLARTYEAENMLDEARIVYEGLVTRHSDYTDANTRLTYIALRQSPTEDGPKAMSTLYEADATNMEVRALYGWFLKKAKRRTPNIAEDQEQRHYKHTLQSHDKHDRYSLTGMGNLYLATAREMRRETEQEKDKRRKMYERAVEFFDKALQLDPRNAYAAQGIGIAMVEDKKDFTAALQIFSKVRETVKDANVFTNLGHVYCELKQYSRAVESYEAALAKDKARDPQMLACLGRAWLLRGRVEQNIAAMNTSLDYSRRALQVAPDQVHFRFNVAFVQTQIATLLIGGNEGHKTLAMVEEAAAGLEEAIETFSAIAKSPNPPFPRSDIEQRANMGRNTLRKQLERAMQNQREYEEKNAARLRQARELREAEMTRRAEEKRKAEEEAEERRRQIAEERQKMHERDMQLVDERKAEEEAERKQKEEEFSVDEETGEKTERRPKRARGKRKKKGGDAEDEPMGERGSTSTPAPASEGERPSKKKKRRLERKTKENSKYKSNEMVGDSDEDEMPATTPMTGTNGTVDGSTPAANGDDSMVDGDENGEMLAEAALAMSRKRPARIVDDEDDDEEGEVAAAGSALNGATDVMLTGSSDAV